MLWFDLKISVIFVWANDHYYIDDNEIVIAAFLYNKNLPFAKREGNRKFDNLRYIFQQDGASVNTWITKWITILVKK